MFDRPSFQTDSLEPRTLFSGSVMAPIAHPALDTAATSVNASPTVAQAISINGDAAVSGNSATLSVLGTDDRGEANLAYTWSVVSAPSGGRATFSRNDTNAAKSATITFTRAGTYNISVRIVDAGGRSVSSVKTAVVTPVLTSLRLTSGGYVVNPLAGMTVLGASQALVAQGLDQFGNVMTAAPAMTWSITAGPTGGPLPVISASGANATITFRRAGAYTLKIQAGSTAVSGSYAITVNPVISALRNTSGAAVSVSGTSARLAIPTFIDQFGDTIATPALTWTISSRPQGAPVPTLTTRDGAPSATFGMAGYYQITGSVAGQPRITFVDVFTVSQTLTSFSLTPGTVTVSQGCNQQFTAKALDQFKQAMLGAQPTITWTATAGTITTAGLFTAPATGTSATITATSGSATGTAAVTLQASGGYQSTSLVTLVKSLDADGSISRADMIQILRSAGSDGSVSAGELADLKLVISQATTLNMPGYVAVLAGDVVNGNLANAKFQGQALGNLAAGSSATQLNHLIDKWFLGADLPALCNTSLVYKSAAGSLFTHAPSHLDERQGGLGDCYFITALGTLADSNPDAVRHMFIDNGDGTFTVRFHTGKYGTIYNYSDGSIGAGFNDNVGTADYVTVNLSLPVSSAGKFAYANYGASYTDSSNSLWIALAEKAYAQWNETNKSGREQMNGGVNAYSAIQGGWMATVDAQVLGHNATDYIMTRTSEQVAVNALAAGQAVTIGTLNWSGTNLGLYANHAYAITAYNPTTDTFTLYNPWGTDQPGQLTWSQLQATTTQLCVCDATGSTPIQSLRGPASQSPFAAGSVSRPSEDYRSVFEADLAGVLGTRIQIQASSAGI